MLTDVEISSSFPFFFYFHSASFNFGIATISLLSILWMDHLLLIPCFVNYQLKWNESELATEQHLKQLRSEQSTGYKGQRNNTETKIETTSEQVSEQTAKQSPEQISSRKSIGYENQRTISETISETNELTPLTRVRQHG